MDKRSSANRLRQSPGAKKRPDEHKARPPVQISQYLPRAILILACAALFLPLAVNGSFYYPYVFLKSILFRVVVQAMVLLYMPLAVMYPSYRPRFNRLIYALLIYFGFMLVSSLPGISVSPWTSWWGDFSRMDGMITQLHLLAFFLVLSQTLKREREGMVLFATSLFSGILMGLTGLIQYLGLDYLYDGVTVDRIRGAAGNSDFFASLMLLNFFLVLWFLSRRDKARTYPLVAKMWLLLLALTDAFVLAWKTVSGEIQSLLSPDPRAFPLVILAFVLHVLLFAWFFARRITWIGTAVLCLTGFHYLYWMILSQTRFGVIGLVGSLATILVLYLWKGAGRRLRWITVGLLLLVCLLPTSVWLNRRASWVQGNAALRRLTSLTYADAAPRLLAWKASFLGILDRPLRGWGPENYQNAFDSHFPPQMFTSLESEVWFDRAHNIPLDIGTTIGVPGLLAYLAFYALLMNFFLRRWFRTRDVTHSLLMIGFLSAYLLQGLFIFDTVNTDILSFAMLAYMVYLHQTEAGGGEGVEIETRSTGFAWRSWVALAAAAGILAPVFLYAVKRPYDSNLLLNRGIALEKGFDPQLKRVRYVASDAVTSLFLKAEAVGTTGRYEVREEFANYVSELAAESTVSLEERVGLIKRALGLLERSIADDPGFARRYLYPASLVNRTYGVVNQADPVLARTLCEKCLALTNRAESLAPTRPQVFIERAQALASLGRPDDAAAALEAAIRLTPEVKAPRVDLVAVLISGGRFGDAEREWKNMKSLGLSPSIADYDRIIERYSLRKQYGQAIVLYGERLARTPGDGVAMAHLAATYRDMGDMESARRTALKAAELSPQVAAGLPDFLRTLHKPE